MKKLITIFVFIFLVSFINANNILVSNVSLLEQNLTSRTCKIKFDVSWDNSWRNNTIPGNWDAAWVFIKARINGGAWQHVSLENTGYTTPNYAIISIPADRKGFFIYRASNGNGSVNYTDCKFLWDYGQVNITSDASIELKVFAIEMVYITQGAFKVGDGSSYPGVLKQGSADNDPWEITSENSITTTNTTENGYYYNSDGFTGTNNIGNTSGDIFTIPAAYPKGYNAFYCMKYELSQQQYVDFLNTLDRTQQQNMVNAPLNNVITPFGSYFALLNDPSSTNRNSIAYNKDPFIGSNTIFNFYCDINDNNIADEAADGQSLACNLIKWKNMAAYLDWSALRPMTELEYEKICRGFNDPVNGEYAWGGAYAALIFYTLNNYYTDNEIITNTSANLGNIHYSINFMVDGPMRCGIFAASTPNPNRMTTGASYFGVMEMSGNVAEQCVSVGNIAGRSFQGQHGDGVLSNPGYGNVDYWPGINGNTDNNTANTSAVSDISGLAGIGSKGGSYIEAPTCIVSNRKNTNFHYEDNGDIGIRGIRTAP
jgi:formylglycine-generating enzyme required for sulfatase activity